MKTTKNFCKSFFCKETQRADLTCRGETQRNAESINWDKSSDILSHIIHTRCHYRNVRYHCGALRVTTETKYLKLSQFLTRLTQIPTLKTAEERMSSSRSRKVFISIFTILQNMLNFNKNNVIRHTRSKTQYTQEPITTPMFKHLRNLK